MNIELSKLSPYWIRDGWGNVVAFAFQCPLRHFGAHNNKHPIIIYVDADHARLTGVGAFGTIGSGFKDLTLGGKVHYPGNACKSEFVIESGMVKFNVEQCRPAKIERERLNLL